MNIDVSLPVVGNGIIIYKKLGLVKQKASRSCGRESSKTGIIAYSCSP
jgi:hypothetical protein